MDFELELSRRQVIGAGLAALVAQALPLARAAPARAADPSYTDGLL
jgi:hypothetical protein